MQVFTATAPMLSDESTLAMVREEVEESIEVEDDEEDGDDENWRSMSGKAYNNNYNTIKKCH